MRPEADLLHVLPLPLMSAIRQKAGLMQAFGVFIDTILICTCSALLMLLAPADKIAELQGMDLLQSAMQYHLGEFGVIFIAVILFLFSFSTFIGILFYARSTLPTCSGTTGCHRPPTKSWHLSCCLSADLPPIPLSGISGMSASD